MRRAADQANVNTGFKESRPDQTPYRPGAKYHDRLGHAVQLTYETGLARDCLPMRRTRWYKTCYYGCSV